jgi:hypothetical protein
MLQGLIAYHKANDITIMKKHVEAEHKILFAKYLEYVVNYLKFSFNWEPTIKRPHIIPTTISRFFNVTNPFARDHGTHKGFLKDVMLYVIKGFYH